MKFINILGLVKSDNVSDTKTRDDNYAKTVLDVKSVAGNILKKTEEFKFGKEMAGINEEAENLKGEVQRNFGNVRSVIGLVETTKEELKEIFEDCDTYLTENLKEFAESLKMPVDEKVKSEDEIKKEINNLWNIFKVGGKEPEKVDFKVLFESLDGESNDLWGKLNSLLTVIESLKDKDFHEKSKSDIDFIYNDNNVLIEKAKKASNLKYSALNSKDKTDEIKKELEKFFEEVAAANKVFMNSENRKKVVHLEEFLVKKNIFFETKLDKLVESYEQAKNAKGSLNSLLNELTKNDTLTNKNGKYFHKNLSRAVYLIGSVTYVDLKAEHKKLSDALKELNKLKPENKPEPEVIKPEPTPDNTKDAPKTIKTDNSNSSTSSTSKSDGKKKKDKDSNIGVILGWVALSVAIVVLLGGFAFYAINKRE